MQKVRLTSKKKTKEKGALRLFWQETLMVGMKREDLEDKKSWKQTFHWTDQKEEAAKNK